MAVRHPQALNAFATTLNGSVTDSDLTWTLTSVTGLPTEGDFFIACNSEIVRVTKVAGSVVTVERGQQGTTAEAHNNAEDVRTLIVADEMLDRIRGRGGEKTLAYGRLQEADGTILTSSDFLLQYAGSSNYLTDEQNGTVWIDCRKHSATNYLTGVIRLMGAVSFTLTIHIVGHMYDVSDYIGIAIQQVSGSAMKGMFMYPNSRIEVNSRATHLSAIGSTEATIGSIGRRDLWGRVTVDTAGDPTDLIDFDVSFDGIHWFNVHQYSFASGSVWAGLYMNNSAGCIHNDFSILAWYEDVA